MAADDWFRSGEWDASEREQFESKLARARRGSRAQYLRIKALSLLEANDDERRQAGVDLMRRVLDDYPDDRFEAAGAHVALARFQEESGAWEQAAAHYRDSLRLHEGTRSSDGAELLLAELIVRQQHTDWFEEAERLLDLVLENGPIIRVEQFRYAVARARLAHHQGRVDEASAFAFGALALFADNRPASSYHPGIGLIRADDATLTELEDLAAAGKPGQLGERVERYRGSEGQVRWEWALISRLRGVAAGSWLQQQDEHDEEAQPLLAELRAAGFEVYDLHEWSQRRLPNAAAVNAAAPILLRWLSATDSPELKATLATALTDRRFRKPAAAQLVAEFRRMRSPALTGHDWPSEPVGAQRRLKDRLANAVATLARDNEFDEIAALIRDRAHGHHRSYLFWTLAHMKNDAAVDLALEMLDDDEMHLPALRALADLRSARAQPIFETIVSRPRPRGRNQQDERERDRIDVATNGLEKLTKARANGKIRP